MNMFTATGHLGQDVDLRYMPNGDAVANFSMAVSKRFTANGEKREKTVWVRVSIWRTLAENCAKYLHKGSKVLVRGELEPINVFTKRDGTPGASYEVTAQEVEFLDGKAGDSDEAPQRTAQAPTNKQLDDVESIPF